MVVTGPERLETQQQQGHVSTLIVVQLRVKSLVRFNIESTRRRHKGKQDKHERTRGSIVFLKWCGFFARSDLIVYIRKFGAYGNIETDLMAVSSQAFQFAAKCEQELSRANK